MAGFSFVKSRSGANDIPRKVQIAASATVTKGDLLEFVSGKAKRINAATDSPACVAIESQTSTATSLTECMVVDIVPYDTILEVGVTPLVDGTGASSGSSTTTVKVALTDGSQDDLVGGIVHFNGNTRIISANTYSSNVVTITFLEAVSAAAAAGDPVYVVPFGFGTSALKLHASTMYNALSSAIADITGGKASVYDVDLKNKKVQVFFVP